MVEVTEKNAVEVAKAVAAGTLPGPAKSLAEAICRVMEQVRYVQKDKQMVGGGSYKYVSVEAVIDAIRPEMIKQQLVLLPVGVAPMTCETFENTKGTRQNRTQVIYTFKMLHAPSGQSEPVVVIGEAIDVGDKSSNKAMTAARKYALIMAFNIETGLDPDDTPSHEQERKPVAQTKPAPQTSAVTEYARQIVAKLDAAKSRADATPLWNQYDADAKANRVSAADRAAIDSAFKLFGQRFPAQTAKA